MTVFAPDARPIVRAGIHAAVDAAPDLEVAEAGADVVVVTDVSTARHHPGARVVLVTDDADAAVAAALSGQARACVSAGADLDEVAEAIRAVARGEALFCAPVADAVVEALSGAPDAAAAAFPELTARERDVLVHLATGAGNWDIARELGLTPKTVRNHLSRIYVKLGVLDRAQAVLRARDAGLGQPSRAPGAVPASRGA